VIADVAAVRAWARRSSTKGRSDMPEDRSRFDSALKTVQALSIVIGIVISVFSFNSAREKDIIARELEARKPFLELRQKRYSEVIAAAAVLVDPENHLETELSAARKRFRELYIAELSMVEAPEVEQSMVKLAMIIDPTLTELTPAQKAAYALSHALRDSFVADWRVNRK
jgi:hypothetical protein